MLTRTMTRMMLTRTMTRTMLTRTMTRMMLTQTTTRGAPAQVGDELLSVNGVRLRGRPGGMAFASSLITGPPGQPLVLSFRRRCPAAGGGERPLEFRVTLVRAPAAVTRTRGRRGGQRVSP